MHKQAISVTLSPDNLIWLKGRARAEGKGSLSEFLDSLVTRARFGSTVPRPVRSLRGVLAGAGGDQDGDLTGLPAAAWEAWATKWDAMLDGLPEMWPDEPGPGSVRRRALAGAVADAPGPSGGKRGRG